MSKSKKVRSKITKLIEKSESEDEEDAHELSFYINDRVKLMKEVLKIIKAKKIKAMAPECIKDLDIEEINSMLLEELLGISNKRLKYIFNGQNPAEDSSSTDEEEERQPIDIISLDDVSEDDFIINVDSDKESRDPAKKKKKGANIQIPKPKKIKKEKRDKKKDSEKLQEENLMSVLELLELQARARAIRSQLLLESNKRKDNDAAQKEVKTEDDSDEEAVIIESPKNDEIVITSSESEEETNTEEKETNGEQPKKKIKLNRQKFNEIKEQNSKTDSSAIIVNEMVCINQQAAPEEGEVVDEDHDASQDKPEKVAETQPATINPIVDKSEVRTEICPVPIDKSKDLDEDDGVILIVDQDEIDNIIGTS